MSQDVAQWLAEVQSLQRKVAELQQERDRAYASADNLRKLYELEATQRQRDTASAQRRVEMLERAVAELRSPQDEGDGKLGIEIARIKGNYSVEQLQTQLVAAKQQCEQLKALLEEEQTAHAKTRESLTAALGDAVDLLAKERGEQPFGSVEQP